MRPTSGRKSGVDLPREKLRLPQRKFGRRQVFHGEQAGRPVFAENFGNSVGQPAPDRAHPGRFRRIALDRRLPERRDLEPRQRALDAEAAPAGLDKADVRGDAARQRRDPDHLLRADEAKTTEGLD